jgi:hypothetical protein
MSHERGALWSSWWIFGDAEAHSLGLAQTICCRSRNTAFSATPVAPELEQARYRAPAFPISTGAFPV